MTTRGEAAAENFNNITEGLDVFRLVIAKGDLKFYSESFTRDYANEILKEFAAFHICWPEITSVEGKRYFSAVPNDWQTIEGVQ